jgi:hypothetical protein
VHTLCAFENNLQDQEYLHKLNIPTDSSKKFPSRKKTDIAHQACLRKQSATSRIFAQAQNSNCLKQEIYITKENRQCTPCKPSKTICKIKNIRISSKFQLPEARHFHYQRKQTAHTMRALENNPQGQEYVHKLKNPTDSSKNFTS